MAADASRSDDALMRRARGGDESAFGALVERHVGALRARIAEHLPGALSRKVSVADVLQETRIVAFDRLSAYDEARGSPGAWLLGIARNKALQAARRHGATAKRGAHREVSRGARVDTANFLGGEPTPSEVAVTRELAERIRLAMDELPEDYREVLHLAQEKGLALAEVAERMGRSREAIKKLYGRALCRCREVFRRLEEGRHG
jgi:RNA polymerase sigma-70 factor (ECF subfamily)